MLMVPRKFDTDRDVGIAEAERGRISGSLSGDRQ